MSFTLVSIFTIQKISVIFIKEHWEWLFLLKWFNDFHYLMIFIKDHWEWLPY